MNRYNLLFVQPYSSFVGGVDTVLLQLIEGLDKEEFKPYVILPGESPYVQKYKMAGAEVYFENLAVFGKPTDVNYYFRNIVNLFKSIKSLNKFVKLHNIHLIHSHKMELLGPNIIGKILGIPTIQTVHELPRIPLVAYKFVGLLNHIFNDRIIVLCDRSKIMFKWLKFESKKVSKIYNGIEPNQLKKTDDINIRKELNLKNDNKIVITVARLSPMKGIEYLIEAANEISKLDDKIKFIVVGDVAFDSDKPYKDNLLRKVSENGLEKTIYFLGLRRDIANLLQQSDVFLLPSVYDIFPTVILEAMSMSLPVIATDVGGVPEMIRSDTGMLIKHKDTNQIKDAVLNIFKKDYKKMGSKGRELFIKEFSRVNYVSNTTSIYKQLLIKKP